MIQKHIPVNSLFTLQQMYLSLMKLCETMGVMTIKCEQSALEKKRRRNDEVKRKKTNKQHTMDDVSVMMISYYYRVNHHDDQATNKGATANSSQWQADKQKNPAGETSLMMKSGKSKAT